MAFPVQAAGMTENNLALLRSCFPFSEALRSSACATRIYLERLEAELLPANGCFIHQSTFDMREYGDALVVAGILRSGCAARCCTTTAG